VVRSVSFFVANNLSVLQGVAKIISPYYKVYQIISTYYKVYQIISTYYKVHVITVDIFSKIKPHNLMLAVS